MNKLLRFTLIAAMAMGSFISCSSDDEETIKDKFTDFEEAELKQ